MSKVVRLSEHRKKQNQVCFSRFELNRLLSIYSRRVIKGEWKDYAIDLGKGSAAFSIFAGASASPTYTIVKYAPTHKGKSEYIVYDGRRRLKRGGSITDVLDVFERDLRLVSS